MPPLAGKRAGARRVAAALLELGGDALALGVRAVTGRGATARPAIEAPRGDEARRGRSARAEEAAAARRAAAAEEAAARLDAARERLRATIAPPEDEDSPACATAPPANDPSAAPPPQNDPSAAARPPRDPAAAAPPDRP